jgi:hypothetical protein
MKIFINNLPFNITETELLEAFKPFGEIESVKLVMNNQTGVCKGHGFVKMPNDDQANKAISQMNEQMFKGRVLTVTEAVAKKTTTPRKREGDFSLLMSNPIDDTNPLSRPDELQGTGKPPSKFKRKEHPGGFKHEARPAGSKRDDRPADSGFKREAKPGGYPRDERPSGPKLEAPTTGFKRSELPAGFKRDGQAGGYRRDERPNGPILETRTHGRNQGRPKYEGRSGGFRPREERPAGFKRDERPGGFQREARPGGFQREARPGGFKSAARPGFKSEGRPGGFKSAGRRPAPRPKP